MKKHNNFTIWKISQYWKVYVILLIKNIPLISIIGTKIKRRLCAIEYHLPREGEISKKRKNINEEMAQLIPISIVDINTKSQVDESERADINDESITQEVINAVGIW